MTVQLSCREIATNADVIAATYRGAQARGVKFHRGYVEAALRCTDLSKTISFEYVKPGWLPSAVAKRKYGDGCIRLVTMLCGIHNSASEAVLNQQEFDKRFCHADAFGHMRGLVKAVLETMGQGKINHPDSGLSLSGTVRRLIVEPPCFVEPLPPVSQPARSARPILSVR